MTFEEILNREANNWNLVFLYREGIFLKAYQHSACLVHLHIKDFKLSRRYIKSVNEHVISLGFPQDCAPKWLNGYKYYDVTDKLVVCEIEKTLSEPDYETWKESVAFNESDRFTPHTHVIEKAPVFKNAYDLMIQIFTFSQNVSKNVRDPLCNRLKELSYELSLLVRGFYESESRPDSADKAAGICDEIEYLLRILKDMKEISVKTYALACERTVSVGRQLTALRGKVTA